MLELKIEMDLSFPKDLLLLITSFIHLDDKKSLRITCSNWKILLHNHLRLSFTVTKSSANQFTQSVGTPFEHIQLKYVNLPVIDSLPSSLMELDISLTSQNLRDMCLESDSVGSSSNYPSDRNMELFSSNLLVQRIPTNLTRLQEINNEPVISYHHLPSSIQLIELKGSTHFPMETISHQTRLTNLHCHGMISTDRLYRLPSQIRSLHSCFVTQSDELADRKIHLPQLEDLGITSSGCSDLSWLWTCSPRLSTLKLITNTKIGCPLLSSLTSLTYRFEDK